MVEVIVRVFHKPVIEATKIMMDVHKKGKGMVGVYPYDIAATKCAQVLQMALRRRELFLVFQVVDMVPAVRVVALAEDKLVDGDHAAEGAHQ